VDKLSAEAKTFLISARGKPEFFEILDYLKVNKAPLYKPVRQNDSDKLKPDFQTDNWKFDSGAYSENMRLIKFLSGD